MGVTALAEDFAGRLLVAGSDANDGYVRRLHLSLDPFYPTRFALEFHNEGLDHYFMTADPNEFDVIGRGDAGPGWSSTGGTVFGFIPMRSGSPGAVRVCRFYGNRAVNPATGLPFGPNAHTFILDGPECDTVRHDPGWIFESFAFHVFPPVEGQCPPGGDPVYRAYNQRAAQIDSNHRFTTSQSIYQQMRASGWLGEGVVMCAPQ